MRTKLQDLREPVRQKREDLVPGPDLVGRVEGTLTQTRSRFVSRDAVLDRLAGVLPGEGDSNNGGEQDDNQNKDEENGDDRPSFSV